MSILVHIKKKGLNLTRVEVTWVPLPAHTNLVGYGDPTRVDPRGLPYTRSFLDGSARVGTTRVPSPARTNLIFLECLDAGWSHAGCSTRAHDAQDQRHCRAGSAMQVPESPSTRITRV